MSLLIEQLLNGVQLSLTLLLVSSGLTLVFGTMHLLNLAHGSFFMLGAYGAAWGTAFTGSWILGLFIGLVIAVLAGWVVERLVLERLFQRTHLDQVLATFGLILIFNEGVRLVWGIQPLHLDAPTLLSSRVDFGLGFEYPVYRLAIIGFGLIALAVLIYVIRFTRLGMQVRAGAFDLEMVAALGVPIERLNLIIFLIGCGLAAFAGIVAAPFIAIQSGMGEPMLILAFVVVVIGGIGSLKGAVLGSFIVGMIDTLGRAYLPSLARTIYSDSATADTVAASVSSMLIFLVMAFVLAVAPSGIFGSTAKGNN